MQTTDNTTKIEFCIQLQKLRVIVHPQIETQYTELNHIDFRGSVK